MSLPRKIAVALTVAGLLLLAISHYRYGLAAQSGLVLSIVPLLFAGLLLGRPGLWITAVSYLAILAVGSWTDLRHGIGGAVTLQDAIAGLLQPVMGCAIVALILDRLILKSDVSHRRNRDLALLCRQLDIEMRKKEQSQAQLIHSQRMDALGKLAGNVAHDFNNLLSVILGYATRSARLSADDGTRERLEKIVATALRGRQLTDKLLTLARSDPPLRETFDANYALNDLLPMVRSMLDAKIDVQSAFCAEPAWIRMDQAELEASVLNIAKNAGDAMPGGGTFRIASERDDEEVRLHFEDSGHGMSAEVAARIFEPFFTTKPAMQGTGIGLAVVYRTVVESGGRIGVQSVPGRGTRFTLHLPRQDKPAHEVDVLHAPT
jgi:signal transduction histidine kinase